MDLNARITAMERSNPLYEERGSEVNTDGKEKKKISLCLGPAWESEKLNKPARLL